MGWSLFEPCDVVRRVLQLTVILVCTLRFVHSKLIALDVSGKSATQQSTYSGYTADQCIDGNVETACVLRVDRYPWWMLDLGGEYWIREITITTRITDGGKLTSAIIRAGNNPNYNENQQCGSTVTSAQAGDGAVIEFRCDPPLLARYITVQKHYSVLSDQAILQFAELTLMEYVPGECEGHRAVDSGLFKVLCKGYLFVSDNLDTKVATSLQGCARFCVGNTRCRAFDFGSQNGICHLHTSVDAECILNSEFFAYRR